MKIYFALLLLLSFFFTACKSSVNDAPQQTNTTFKMTAADNQQIPYSVKFFNTGYGDSVWVGVGDAGSVLVSKSSADPTTNSLRIRFNYGWGLRDGQMQQAAGKYFDTGSIPFMQNGDTLYAMSGTTTYRMFAKADSINVKIFLWNEDINLQSIGHTFSLTFKQ